MNCKNLWFRKFNLFFRVKKIPFKNFYNAMHQYYTTQKSKHILFYQQSTSQ